MNKEVNISKDALAVLSSYQWPGNLRELRNVIERAMQRVKGSMILLSDLPSDVTELLPEQIFAEPSFVINSEMDFSAEDRKRILGLLLETNGNKSRVAKELGISRSTLYKKMKYYKL